MNPNNMSEQKRLYHTIGVLDFVLVDLREFLDTHPYDADALQYYQHYNQMKQQAMSNYAAKYGPLNPDQTNSNMETWKWALQPMPWEGGYDTCGIMKKDCNTR